MKIVTCASHEIDPRNKFLYTTDVHEIKFIFLDLKFEVDNYLIMYNCSYKTFSCVYMYIIYHTRKTKTITFGM